MEGEYLVHCMSNLADGRVNLTDGRRRGSILLVLGHRLGLLHLFPGRNSLDFVVVMMIWHRLTKRLIAGTIDEKLNHE